MTPTQRRRWLPAVVAVLVAFVAVSLPAALAQETAGARAYRHVQALAAMGPRVAGGPADRRAADYVAARLREYAYEARLQPFTFPYFETRAVSLEITAPGRLVLSPRALFFSPGTSGTLTAAVVPAGKGLPGDFSGVDVRGRIALVERGQIRFGEKVENAARAGAVAIVVYDDRPGNVVGTLGGPGRIPAVMITQDQGRQLLRLAQAGQATAVLRVETINEQRTTYNVIGALAGRAERKLVIGGHRDSVESSPGANDNASGVAAMLEIARLLRAQPPAVGLEFVAFGAEDLGLFGSEHYVRSDAFRGVAGMINLDMVGVGDRLLLGNSRSDPRLVDAAIEAAGSLEIAAARSRMGASDHAPFERAGVPVLFIHREPDPRYHSPQDTAEHVRPEHLDDAVRIAVAAARSRAAASSPARTVPVAHAAAGAGFADR